MARILRIGTDSTVNYTFEATSAYDADNPAATTGPWSDSDAMDQSFHQASPTEVAAEGCLVTFQRFPDAFSGAMVKVKPTYDADAGEVPALEMWTHDSSTGEWTLRRSIDIFNPFVGARTGARKVFDLTLFPFLTHVDKVWLTMNPGAVGTPSLDFDAIKLFGQCDGALHFPASGGTPDECKDPLDPFYTGFDAHGNPCPGTTFTPVVHLPQVDICNPKSVATYRNALEALPGALEAFDAWYVAHKDNIAKYCAGIIPSLPVPPPTPPTPRLPALDLCDPVSIEAFRAAIAGDAEQLAAFDAFIDGLETSGFFALTCPPADPPDQYIDPHTLGPANDPDPNPDRPFGQGPGGDTPPASPVKASEPPRALLPQGSGEAIEYVVFFFAGGAPTGAATPSDPSTAQAWFGERFNDAAELSTELNTAYARALRHNQIIVTPNADGALTGVKFDFSGAVGGTVVNVRMIQLGIAGSIVGLSQTIAPLVAMNGNGFPGAAGPIDTGAGAFATANPIPGANYYRLNRPEDLSGLVNFLRVKFANSNPTGTGTGLNWGCGLMVRIIATAPGEHSAVTVVSSWY